MTLLRGCADRREEVAALVMGALPVEEAMQVERHLESCDRCRRLYESLRQQEEDLLWAFGQLGSGALGRAACRTLPPLQQPARMAGLAGRLARGMARLGTTGRVAIAASVLAAVVGVWVWSHHPSQQVESSFGILAQSAYARVLHEIDQTRSVRYRKTYSEEDGPTLEMQETVRDGGFRRRVLADGGVIIDHFMTRETLAIYPARKEAVRTLRSWENQDRYNRQADWLRTLKDRDGVYTGQELLDGTLTDVYKVDQPYEKITIWADVRTCLPVRIQIVQLPCTDKDIRVPSMCLSTRDFMDEEEDVIFDDGRVHGIRMSYWNVGMQERRVTMVLTDFEWDINCDDSWFSLAAPDGYTVHEMREGFGAAEDENSLVAALRFWAETSGGRFPENINMLGDSKPKLINRYFGVGTPDESLQQAAQMMQTVLAGMAFAQVLKIKDNWYYAGEDVVLGEADKPLCWWRQEGAETFRVVYGDLSLRDAAVPPEMPPHSVAGVPATQP